MTQKGGAVSKLDLPGVDSGESLKAHADMLLVAAHGVSHPRLTMAVPKKTYVLFLSPAGERCGLEPQDKQLRKYLGQEGDAFWDSWYQILSGKGRPADTGIPFYSPRRGENRETVEAPVTVSIYEPGDEMPIMKLFMTSELDQQLIATGVYELPHAPDLFDVQEDMAKFSKQYLHGGVIWWPQFLLPEVARRIVAGNKHYTTRKDNLVVKAFDEPTAGIDTESLFRDVLGPAPADKVRILIFYACRVIQSEDVPEEIGKAWKGGLRRKSLTLRKYEAAAAALGGAGGAGGAGAGEDPVRTVAREIAMREAANASGGTKSAKKSAKKNPFAAAFKGKGGLFKGGGRTRRCRRGVKLTRHRRRRD